MRNRSWLWLLAFAPLCAAAAETKDPSTAQREIAHLLDYLGQSRCQFERNGRRYGAGDARGHLERKLRHLRKRHADAGAEAFIAHAATGSSLSGKPYRVHCPGQAAVPSAAWFRAELERLRTRR